MEGGERRRMAAIGGGRWRRVVKGVALRLVSEIRAEKTTHAAETPTTGSEMKRPRALTANVSSAGRVLFCALRSLEACRAVLRPAPPAAAAAAAAWRPRGKAES